MLSRMIGLATLLWASCAAAETVRVEVNKLAFAPAQISANVGDTIEWANGDFVAHTATTRTKQWDVVIPANGVGRMIVKTAGVFVYYCRFHPNMEGQVVVTDH